MRHVFALVVLLLCGSTAVAGGVTVGQPLPLLEIADPGEIRLAATGETYRAPWSSASLDSEKRVQIVQYMAGRPAVERRVRRFSETLEARSLPPGSHQLVSIVNLDDVTFGAAGMALRELEKSKPHHPETVLVGDADGLGLAAWGLQPRDVAVMILGLDGRVVFFRQGTMDSADTGQALDLIARQVAELGAAAEMP